MAAAEEEAWEESVATLPTGSKVAALALSAAPLDAPLVSRAMGAIVMVFMYSDEWRGGRGAQ